MSEEPVESTVDVLPPEALQNPARLRLFLYNLLSKEDKIRTEGMRPTVDHSRPIVFRGASSDLMALMNVNEERGRKLLEGLSDEGRFFRYPLANFPIYCANDRFVLGTITHMFSQDRGRIESLLLICGGTYGPESKISPTIFTPRHKELIASWREQVGSL